MITVTPNHYQTLAVKMFWVLFPYQKFSQHPVLLFISEPVEPLSHQNEPMLEV